MAFREVSTARGQRCAGSTDRFGAAAAEFAGAGFLSSTIGRSRPEAAARFKGLQMYDQVGIDLEKIIALLEKDQNSWARLFRQARRAFDAEDFQSCGSIILSGSGGMGSLNDLVLGQGKDEQGNFHWKDGYQELNDTFQTLLGRLYEFSRACLRSHSAR